MSNHPPENPANITQTIPVEQFAGFMSKELFNDPKYHEHMARVMIPSTHTMLSWHAEESRTDILTGEKRYAIVAYAYQEKNVDTTLQN